MIKDRTLPLVFAVYLCMKCPDMIGMARMNTLWTLVLVAAGVFHGTLAYPMFSDRLPNGNFIPHPCMTNFVWKGVGHEAVLGGGSRNPFGVDFAENGFKWDSCICEQDSDGDGLTNGEEMGDPDCSWVPGEPPKHKFGLSHPGVCEPMDSAECRARNTFEIDCDALVEFTCDAINNPDVRNITLRFPETPVPPHETSYFCMTFDIDADDDYHMIAYEPIISNVDVMHHLLIYGCIDTTDDPLIIPAPAECGMASYQCQDIIGLWTVGTAGNCLPQEYGFAIGRHGYKKIMMQIHWTNPTERTDYVDSSGMTIYYTSNLRDNTAGILSTGQFYLQIPPVHSFVPQDGDCASECTSRLPHPLHIAEVVFHMHYLGHSGYTELWRDGVKVTDLVKTDDYDYDRPDIVIKSPTVELRPGDYLKTRCNFNSLNRDKITFFGEGSYDEMCISFSTYYPALPSGGWRCGSYSSADFCSLPSNQTDNGNTNATSEPDHCEIFFADESSTAKLEDVVTYCDNTGSKCLSGCEERIDVVRASPCFQGPKGLRLEIFYSQKYPSLANLRYAMHSCDDYDLTEDEEDDNGTDNEPGGSSRYDPDVNGLPSGGVCPWGGGDQSSDGMAAVYGRAPAAAVVVALGLMLLAAQYML